MMVKKKILVISSLSASLINFRFDLLKDLVAEGYDVVALGPDNDAKTIELLHGIGVKFKQFDLQRTGFNPLADWVSIRSLKRIYKEEMPDFILPYTVKPVIYGNLAKRGTKIRSLNWITGLGFYGLESKTIKDRLSKALMTYLYRKGISKDDIIAFQNNDDLQFFKRKGILRKSKYRITPGSGINLETFPYTDASADPLKFIFVGRLIEAKGIRLFIKAAQSIKERFSDVEFIVAGKVDKGNPNAIQEDEINTLMQQGVVNFLGHVPNIEHYVRNSSVFVLPSMYREGVPRSILEALSIGRPIITTDNVGCRETVVPLYNGVLIPKNNVDALIDGMEYFCKNREAIVEFGKNSHKLAEEKFDITIVNRIMLDALKQL